MSRANLLRNAELAKIHILAKQRGLIDGDDTAVYRDALEQITGKRSAADLTSAERSAVLDAWSTQQRRPRRKKTGTPQSRLVYHLWRQLEAAGHADHDGLGRWLRNHSRRDDPSGKGWERPEFTPPDVLSAIIEQLKKWNIRVGLL